LVVVVLGFALQEEFVWGIEVDDVFILAVAAEELRYDGELQQERKSEG
jgi:hypothetical protein